jgi:hypothetical protein
MEVKVMNWTMSLFALCSVAGLVMVVGSLFLLWKGRIILEKQGDNNYSASEIELPMGIKLKTQFPVLIMFLFGAFMLFVPIHYCPQLCKDPASHLRQPLEMVELRGSITSDAPVEVNVIADERKTDTKQGIVLSIPYYQNSHYIIKYYDTDGNPMYSENVDLREGEKQRQLIGYDQRDTIAKGRQPYGAARDFERSTPVPDNLVAQFKSQQGGMR